MLKTREQCELHVPHNILHAVTSLLADTASSDHSYHTSDIAMETMARESPKVEKSSTTSALTEPSFGRGPRRNNPAVLQNRKGERRADASLPLRCLLLLVACCCWLLPAAASCCLLLLAAASCCSRRLAAAGY